MRPFEALLIGMALLAGAPLMAQAPSANQRKLPPAFATGKRDIEIPFSVTQGTTPESQASRVDVYVSWDHGRNWFKHAEVPPDAGKFRFIAKKDMEFWFLTKTIIGRESAPRDEVKWPQLRLIVDTQKPDLKMTALVSPSGQPELTWSVTDATLNPATLKIEYQDAAGSDENWRGVELSAKENVASASGIAGKKSLVLPAGTKAINVRAEVSDVAGNKSIFTQHLVLPTQQDLAAAEHETPPQLADASARHWPREGELSANPARAAKPFRESDSEPEPKLVQNPYAGKGRLAALPAQEASESALPAPGAEGSLSGEPSNDSTESMPPPSRTTRDSQPVPQHSDEGDIGPIPDAETLPPTRPTQVPDAGPALGQSIPAGDRPRLSSARRFNLDYDVDAVGPEGIADVELWGTNDGGKTWIKWGTDPDHTSPMEVEVSHETVYGFRVVVAGKNGLVGNRPSGGDMADIWIETDLTKPAARLTAAAYGAGEHAGELDIRWEAQDEHLGPRPITLSFSDRPDGKYTTIAAGLPNTGQYFWRFDPRSPRQIYLRLEVRDDAGNVTSDQLADPINVEGLTPKGRIRSLTPTGTDSSRTPFRAPLFK